MIGRHYFEVSRGASLLSSDCRHCGEGIAHQSHDRYPPGARVQVDGQAYAIVREAFPQGSSSYFFPHYKVDFVDGDRNVAVHWNRVT